MKRNTLIIISVFFIISSFALPFICRIKSESINQTLALTGTLLSSFAGILTFIIALQLYNKFGIENTLLEKSSSVVFSFLEVMKETRFFIIGEKYGIQISFGEIYHSSFESYYGTKLLFSIDYMEALEAFFDLSDSPFMPKSIVSEIEKMRCFIIAYNVKEEDLYKYSIVQANGKAAADGKYGRFNDEELTLLEFLNIMDEVKSVTINWITKNSAIAADLNL